MTTRPRSLADDLRSRTVEQLCALVIARPDLVDPVPQSLGNLSVRATAVPSVARALDRTDRFALQVLAAMGELPEPATASSVAAAMGVPLPRVAETIDTLWREALVWGADGEFRVVRTVRESNSIGMHPIADPPLSVPVTPAPIHRDSSAIAHAVDTLASVAQLCYAWEDEPPAALRTGGISARDVASAARQIGATPGDTALLIELAAAARLVAPEPGAGGTWQPTDLFDEWIRETGERRWQSLVDAWLGQDELHELLIDVLTPHDGAIAVDDLVRIVDDRTPRLASAARHERIRDAARIMDLLGLTVGDSLANPGRSLSIELPSPVSQLLIQGDLTAIAPGPLEPAIAHTVRQIADVESAGHATVFRFSASSVARGFAHGLTSSAIIGFLQQHSSTGIPQPLDYLVKDIARRAAHAAAPPRHRQPTPPAPSAVSVDATTIVRLLLEADGSPAPEPIDAVGISAMSSGRVVAALRDAVAGNARLRIGYAESTGRTSERSIEPIRLAAGRLTAYDHSDDTVRTFAVARITGVVSA